MATDPSTERLSSAPTTTPEGSPVPSGWLVVAESRSAPETSTPIRSRRLLAQLLGGVLLVLALVAVLGSYAAQKLAEREAVNDAATIADVLAESVIQPNLTAGLLTEDATAIGRFDTLIRSDVLSDGVVRVKLWAPDGRVVYADEPQLIGRRFPLSADQIEALRTPATKAEISTLQASENEFEVGDRLIEVYRPVWTSSGETLLFEMYGPYEPVGERAGQLWRGFAGVTLSSLVLLIVLVAPILWTLLRRLRRADEQRADLLQSAVDSSADERRRIAASLHDGPVQELAASSFSLSGAAARAQTLGEDRLATELAAASTSVRSSIRALRTLLVDIYPASLATSGLRAALTDLARSTSRPDVTVELDLDVAPEEGQDLGLSDEQERQAFRVAQECLRNTLTHAGPCTVRVRLSAGEDCPGTRCVVLTVVDDGVGFDAAALLAAPAVDHFGLRLLADTASSATAGQARLEVRSAPGCGTQWRLHLTPGRTLP